MSAATHRIGFGGGCHWCTEAVFQHVDGVTHVNQGWASGDDDPERYSEAVLVDYDPARVSLEHLVRVHLHTHACTSDHAMRRKYRSAVYGFSDSEMAAARAAIERWQVEFERPIVTEVVGLGGFRQNTQRYQDYYRKNPEGQFCRRYVEPKLAVVRGGLAAPAAAPPKTATPAPVPPRCRSSAAAGPATRPPSRRRAS